MKGIFALLIICCGLLVNAQDNCLQFSKKGKKTVYIKEGRNISFVFKGCEYWGKGKVMKITVDSLFLEQSIVKSDILSERESNFTITAYSLKDFRMMAYNSTPKAVGKSSIVVLLVAAAIIGGGAGVTADLSDSQKNTKAKYKFFKKNVDFDRGWLAQIDICD